MEGYLGFKEISACKKITSIVVFCVRKKRFVMICNTYIIYTEIQNNGRRKLQYIKNEIYIIVLRNISMNREPEYNRFLGELGVVVGL